ncbi:methionine ABC transporter permease [Microbacterium amylolyticum]|uniref:D-methionine transport system permease protein n=1 Tax=Microbacterium amylolyticum TaxID=936337 RepID=A0ABS4ZL99_9MICO|nr:methionine ABC transporter permease [Microbacterium amylolyticum]MBP2437730.1 D-methionine transport system permease protein [Microbacterium amylolyticum]
MIDTSSPDFWPTLLANLWKATYETLYMVGVTMIVTFIVGLALGVLLVTTDRGGVLQAPFGRRGLGRGINVALTIVVNLTRSIPFLILMIALIPFTRLLLGSAFSTTAAIVPLSICAIPFFARLAEISLREVDPGKVEAAEALGSTRWAIVSKVLIAEALPGMIRGFATTVVSIINFSAITGTIGAGGLGDLAVRYGYQRYSTEYIICVIVVLVVLVQALQSFGEWLAKRLDRGRSADRPAPASARQPAS